ncbi:immunity 22 family protein (plasmid) [Tistrella mobilis]|uniref:immunity 22 family protein n=1 Tax=Tistrella mobilis TaxID=171437 RepID=UPI0035584EDF
MTIKPRSVSVWVGDFGSEEAMTRYFEEDFTEDGDAIPSPFQATFHIDYDPYKFEADIFKGTSDIARALDDASYSEYYADDVKRSLSIIGEVNTICIIFDCDPPQKKKDAYLTHILYKRI